MTLTELPLAAPVTHRAPRWVPSRAGILNVWRYYDEVFSFHDGRLLLRGPNGSGKSKALELLLPFLFDANLRASRLSTFGTSERTMHWNLMGEGASGTTRVGYVWLEFRVAAGAESGWFSCGARLQASTHTTTVHADYFTTSLRIGTSDGISLVNPAGQPLTRSALEEQLGDDGVLHGNAADYRNAVRTTLFPGLTEVRYDALITALLQLRTPKLSQRLDPALLSTLLSRALPPLGHEEITELAEGFERLDRQRERLKDLDEEVTVARTLAGRQRTYAQRVLRAHAAVLISATTELDNLTRAARRSAEEHEVMTARKQERERLNDALGLQADSTRARITGITDDDVYKEGQELDQLRQRTAQAADRAATIRADADAKRLRADTDEADLHEAQRLADQRGDTTQALWEEAQHGARRAGLASVCDEVRTSLEAEPRRAPALLRAAVTGRHGQLATVGHALDAHDQAVERRQQAEADLDEARTTLSRTQEKQVAAAAAHDFALTRLSDLLTQWAAACHELVFLDLDVLLESIEPETALVALIDRVAAGILEGIVRDETVLSRQREDLVAQRGDLTRQLQQLADQQDLPPDPPPFRTADRRAMAGAPLWRLVDFAGPVPGSARGPIEAALQASGLLDAWVSPTGWVSGHDILADPEALAPAPGRSLADALVPEPGAAVPDAVIERLLASVALGDQAPASHPAAIGLDGSWRLGNLHGTWHKDQPGHVGAAARQRAREQRIQELNRQLDACAEAIAALEARLAVLHHRRLAVAGEKAARPDHRELSQAAQAVVRAEAEVAAADRIVAQRADAVTARERQVTATLMRLTSVAAENSLPTDREALARLGQAVDDFRDQGQNWLDSHRELLSAQQALASVTRQAERSEAEARQRGQEAGQAESEHLALAERLSGRESTVGADYRQILAELADLRAREAGLRRQLAAGQAELPVLAERMGELNRQRADDAAARDGATAARDAAAQRFRHLATGTFPADAGLDGLAAFEATLSGSDGVRAALEAARQTAAAWPSVPYAPASIGDALHRLSESVHAGRSSLKSQAYLDLETDEDVQVLSAVVNGIRVGAAELLRILRSEAERSRQDITDQERELFDQTLTGDTRRHLADRIRQANELVDGMNSRLELVRTASKVAVRLVWQVAPDLPPGTKAARDLLLKDPVRLTDTDRESLHRFFRERIDQARADDTATSWEQQLSQVFDYTSWHQFVVKIDRANGTGWQLLTRKLHGALSGGEKAIVLHLPLFAAVAAHYQAVPQAPRVILLDEVFVGVDSSNRGQVFALLSALDLDLVLTSDHEWCTYAELSGIGIHQLITGSDGDDAVTTASFTWNGHELLAADPAGAS